ncbi:MAG: hypothetical protein ABJQ34_20785 [Paracoccaceae bacterium]
MRRHIRSIASASLSLSAGIVHLGWVRLVLLAIFIAVAAYYILPRAQSFTVVAATQSVTVNLMPGTQTHWELKNVTVCLRRSREPSVEAEVKENAGSAKRECNAKRYSEMALPKVDILWTAGHRLKITGFDKERLAVEVATNAATAATRIDGRVITDNSLILFDRATIPDLGGLVATGKITIGELAEASAARLTRGGVYHIRENYGFPARKSIISSGQILPGDLVRLVDRRQSEINSTMFLTQSAHPLADFEVILTSPEQHSAIEITRIGGAQSSITTTWIDRVSNDALPVALSILLGLFGASLGIARSLSTDVELKGKGK